MTEARILLVESDPRVASLLRRFLERSGHVVVEATNAEDARAQLRADPFEVLLLRMNLGDGRAHDVMADAQAVGHELSMVLTGSRSTADRFAQRTDCVGAIFLIKPFTARDLARVMDDALMQHRLLIDSIPAEALDLDDVFDDAIDASVGPASLQTGRPHGYDLGVQSALGLGGGAGGLLPPPSNPPADVAAALARGDGTDDLGSLLGPSLGSAAGWDAEDEAASEADAALGGQGDVGDLLDDGGAAPGLGAEAAPEPFDPPAPPRTETQLLIRDGQLFAGTEEARVERWDAATVEAEAAQQRADMPPEDEVQFRLRPMVGDAPDDPRGIYGEQSLPAILVSCFRDMFTGRLVLQRGSVHKVVAFAGGQIVSTSSNLRSEELGQSLLQSGLLRAEDLALALTRAQADGTTLEATLLAQGAVTPTGLGAQLAQLAQERVLNCFRWLGGEYGLAYDPRLDEAPADVAVDPLALVLRGVLTALPSGPILAHYEHHTRRPVRTTERLEAHRRLLDTQPGLMAVARLCDGRQVAEVVAHSTSGMGATLKALRALEYLQCLRFGDAAPIPSVSPAAPAALVDAADRGATGERRIYRQSTGSLRGMDSSEGGSVGGASQARSMEDDEESSAGELLGREARASSRPAPARAPEGSAGRDSRSMRAVRGDTSGRRTGVYRSGRQRTGTHEAQATGTSTPPARTVTASAPVRRMSTGSLRPVAGRAAAQPAASASQRPADIAALKRQLQEKQQSLSRATHYELLGIASEANADEVRAAYQLLSKQIHQAAAHDQRLAGVATEVGRRLAEAASVLCNRRQRAQYDAIHLASTSGPSLERDAEAADRAMDRGRTCLDRGDFPEAFEFFDRASRMAPDMPLNRMYRAYAKFRLSYPKHRKAAIEAHDDLKKALLEDAAQDEGFVLMAHIYRETGNVEMSVKFYRKALSLNRNNRAAAEAMAVLTGAHGPDDTGGSLFGRLFKR